MKWSRAATELFERLIAEVPPERRELQRKHALEHIEGYCDATRVREVGTDQFVIGYIRATPAHLRSGLKGTLRAKGVIVEKYNEHFLSPV